MVGVVDLAVADEVDTTGGHPARLGAGIGAGSRYRRGVAFNESILHVDMDAFFVAVERRHRPELRGRPVAVGGTGPRGVIASASYEARRYGVRSAMPTSRARRLCRSLVVVPPDHARYVEASEAVFEVFGSFTPRVEGLSLDEAFLDVSGLRRHYPDPEAVAEALRRRVAEATGLVASVGIAATKLVAKLASADAKPDGVLRVPTDEVERYLAPKPVGALWGVGEATRAALERLGVHTVGELAAVPERVLERELGPSLGAHLARVSRGIDPRPVVPDSEVKSVSVEQTYPSDLSDRHRIDSELLKHADRLAYRLRRGGLRARTVTVKVRFADFSTVTRSHTRQTPTATTRDLYADARRLLGKVPLRKPVRLLGVGASGLEPEGAPRQLQVGDDDGWERISEAVDSVRERFGTGAVVPARLVAETGSDEASS